MENNSTAVPKHSKRHVPPVDYKALEEGVIQASDKESKKDTRSRSDDPDYLPTTSPFVKKKDGPKPTQFAKRQLQVVDYRSLDGGNDEDDELDASQMTKRRPQTARKRPRVQVSFGAPPADREVVHGNSDAAPVTENNGPAPGKRRFVLVRVPSGSADKVRLVNVARKSEGSTGDSLPGAGSSQHRRIVMAVPSTPIAVRPTPGASKTADPYALEDALFMQEVNKFLNDSVTSDLTARPSPAGQRVHVSKASPVQPRKTSNKRLPGNEVDTVDLDFNSSPTRQVRSPAAVSILSTSLLCSLDASRKKATVGDVGRESGEESVACSMCGSRFQARQLRRHDKICKGVMLTWTNGAYVSRCESEGVDRLRQVFRCPRCSVTLPSDSEFQMHLAIEHGYFWRLDFDSEPAFQDWFCAEALNEAMIAGQSMRRSDIEERYYYCALNGCKKSNPDQKCPSRVVVRKSTLGVSARFFPAHNHCQRVLRRAMTPDCRALIVRLVELGKSNAEILKEIQTAYPATSHNHHISKELISSVRYKHRQRRGAPDGAKRRGRKPKELLI